MTPYHTQFVISDHPTSVNLAHWKDYQYSLTDKLSSAKGCVQLEVLTQGFQAPLWWDRYFLSINDQAIFCREIMMKHQSVAYWYARTIIPQACYNLNPNFFKRLEQESLRHLIFDNNQVHRVSLHSYLVDSHCIEFHWIKKYVSGNWNSLWVRLAKFCFQESDTFYLVEILLPELEQVT